MRWFRRKPKMVARTAEEWDQIAALQERAAQYFRDHPEAKAVWRRVAQEHPDVLRSVVEERVAFLASPSGSSALDPTSNPDSRTAGEGS